MLASGDSDLLTPLQITVQPGGSKLPGRIAQTFQWSACTTCGDQFKRQHKQNASNPGRMLDISELDPTLPVVKNMLLMDNEGKRIAVNYYSSEWCVLGLLISCVSHVCLLTSGASCCRRATVAQQANFEVSLFAKTSRTNARGEGGISGVASRLQSPCANREIGLSSCGGSTVQLTILSPLFLLAAEVIAFDNVVVVYKFVGDLMFYVSGGADENELLLYSVLNGFVDSISLLLRCVPNWWWCWMVLLLAGACYNCVGPFLLL